MDATQILKTLCSQLKMRGWLRYGGARLIILVEGSSGDTEADRTSFGSIAVHQLTGNIYQSLCRNIQIRKDRRNIEKATWSHKSLFLYLLYFSLIVFNKKVVSEI
jgi:hypothetical protein